jgi:assimilatory nitrate reductase catalytic subunit
VSEVAQRMGFGRAFQYGSAADIFREHAALSAFENGGTRDFDIGALAALTDREYEELKPVRWPVPVAAPGGEVAPAEPFADGRFFTPSGKARLVPTVPRAPVRTPTSALPLVLNTGRIRDQWHTMTRTGAAARLGGHHPEPFVQVHATDAVRHGVHAGGLAEIASDDARVVVRVEITDAVQPGQIFVPMHWSDQTASAGRVGELIGSFTDPISGQPELKCAPVKLRRFAAAWFGFALSRRRLSLRDCSYVARARGEGYWRYELAGEACPASWSNWATEILGPDEDRIELCDPRAGRYRGACVTGGRLQACLFVAADAALPSRGWLGSLFGADELGDAARLGILAGRAVHGAAETGAIVCSCFSVGRTTLVRAIRTQALVSTADIGRALRAGTNCGSCVPELKSLLAEAAGASGA